MTTSLPPVCGSKKDLPIWLLTMTLLWYHCGMTIKITDTEPAGLVAAKKRYGDGIWEPRLLLGKPNRRGVRQILGVDHDGPKTFWPWKKWILHDGKWIPSIEMYEKPERLSYIERMRLKHREWLINNPPPGK